MQVIGPILLCTLAVTNASFANSQIHPDDTQFLEDGAQRQTSTECFTKSTGVNITCGDNGRNDQCCNKRCRSEEPTRCSCSRLLEYCKGTADCCTEGWSCVNSRCECSTTGDTVSDYKECCSRSSANNKCQCSKEDKYCTSNLDCCKGHYCGSAKKCKPQVNIGGQCRRNIQCVTGVCSSRRCACAPALGSCVKKADCCPLPGKPVGAVGCVLGVCGDCVPSNPNANTELQEQVCFKEPGRKYKSEACCVGQCMGHSVHICAVPTPTGGYCTGDGECFGANTCVDNKCTPTKCNGAGAECRTEGTLPCCGGSRCTCCKGFTCGSEKCSCVATG